LLLEPLELRALPSVATPVANNDFTSTDGTHPVLIQVLTNDSAPAGFNLASVAIVSAAGHGTAVADGTGDITYTPGPNFTGSDTFSYDFKDSNGVTSNVATVTVVVSRPTANDDEIDTDAGNPVTIPVLENDNAPAGLTLNPASVTVGHSPAHGIASVDPNTGTITYTPQQGFSGTDVFTYTVADSDGAVSNPARVTVVVNRPQANDDFAQTNMNAPVTINILDNDTDPDGPNKLNPASVTILLGPSHGSASIDTSTGAVTYTPLPGFFGTDAFSYTVKDVNNAVSNPANVTITVKATGVVNDDSIDTDAGNPVVIDVLANDTSPNGFKLNTLAVQTPPGHGSATVNAATGGITYTPAQGFAGTDAFTYTVQDNSGNTLGPAHVAVVVNRPKANDDFIDTDAGNPVTVPVLANDTDPDGPNKLNPASVAVVTPPGHGTTSMDTATGDITYTPAQGFSGTDTFAYTVTDVNGAVSNPAMVTVVVNRPQANDDAIDTDGTNPVTVPVLANDTDPDGPNKLNPASVAVITPPAHGSVTVNTTTGDITYTAVAGFAGTDTFTYTVTDFAGAVSNAATVSVTVNRPTAENDTASAFGTSPVTIDVLANDSDPDGPGKIDPSTVTVVGGPGHGSVVVNDATGAITYTPSGGFSGVDTFTYTVKDFPGATSNVATVTVAVNPPTANPDSVTTVGTTPVAVNVLANDTDPNGTLAPGSVVVTASPSHGHVTVNPATGQVTYTAAPGFLGADTFSYTVTDSFGSPSNPATVTVNVTEAPAPVITVSGKGHHGPNLVVQDPHTGAVDFVLTPYGHHFHGGLTFALGDVNGDGVPDIIASAAHGHHPVLLFNGTTGSLLASLRPGHQQKVKKVRVATGDVNGDGVADVLVLLVRGHGSVGEAFDGRTDALIGPLTPAAIDQFFGHG
jgi:hypothetical protein